MVPPKFKTELEPEVSLIVGAAKEWVLPETESKPYTMADSNPILASIPNDLKLYVTFDAE